MKPKHQAIVAGLALSLTLGVAAPIPMFAQTDTVQQQDIAGNANADPITDVDAKQPAPSDYDPGDEYSEAVDSSSLMTLSFNSIMATSSSSLQPMALSSELKYFAQNESGSNYNLGFSYGDGYHAMGFCQFDRRYALVDFMQECYSYNPQKYGMFKAVIDRGGELKRDADDVIYDKRLTSLPNWGSLPRMPGMPRMLPIHKSSRHSRMHMGIRSITCRSSASYASTGLTFRAVPTALRACAGA